MEWPKRSDLMRSKWSGREEWRRGYSSNRADRGVGRAEHGFRGGLIAVGPVPSVMVEAYPRL